MRLIPRLSQLFGHAAIALLLAVTVVALPVAGVVACPVEQFDTDSCCDETREVELAAPRAAESLPSSRSAPVHSGSRPAQAAARAAAPDRTSPLSPFGRPLGSRLRR